MKKREQLRLKMPVLACMLVLLLCGCSKAQWEYRPITDINNMEGRRVAVNLALEAAGKSAFSCEAVEFRCHKGYHQKHEDRS